MKLSVGIYYMSSENNTAILPTDISSNFSHVIVAVEPEIHDIRPTTIGPLEIKTREEPTDITPLIAPIVQERIAPIVQERIAPIVQVQEQQIATEPNPYVVEIDTFITALVPSASKYSVNLTPQEIAIITALVNDASGTILPQIKTTIEGLLKDDGAISLHDIPQLVLLITQLFQSNLFAVKNINLLNVIKYTLDSLLDSKILPIPNGLESVAKSIVDTSIELLNTTIPVAEEECWTLLSYLYSCFSSFKPFLI